MPENLLDLHTHTVASGHAYSTFKEVVDAARHRGLKYLAVTDHGPDMPGGASLYHFWNLKVVPGQFGDLRVFKGVEANIIDVEGNIDITPDVLAELEFVVVSFHPYFGYDGLEPQQYTNTLLKVLDLPYVDMIGHLANPMFPVDYEKVLKKAQQKKVLIEVNNASLLPSSARVGAADLERDVLKVQKQLGAPVVLNSDAHYSDHVGEIGEALELVREVGIPDEQVLNFQPDALVPFLRNVKDHIV